MWVVALRGELYEPWDLFGVLEERERESYNGGSTDVVVGIRDGDMGKFPDGFLVGCTSTGELEGIYTSTVKNRVLRNVNERGSKR